MVLKPLSMMVTTLQYHQPTRLFETAQFSKHSRRAMRPGSIKVSRLNAPNIPPTAPPPPRRGKNQCAKSMAPNLVVHSQRLFKDVQRT